MSDSKDLTDIQLLLERIKLQDSFIDLLRIKTLAMEKVLEDIDPELLKKYAKACVEIEIDLSQFHRQVKDALS